MVNLETAKSEILEWVSQTIRVPVEEIEMQKPLTELGLDSLDAVDMIARIEQSIQQELPENVIQRVTSLNDIFEMMRQRVAAA